MIVLNSVCHELLGSIKRKTIVDMNSGVNRSPIAGIGNYAAGKAAREKFLQVGKFGVVARDLKSFC